jgi:hypothetical protein
MKATINGKRYDSEKCEKLAERDHRSHSNNYSGTTYLLRASDGKFLLHTSANGQDWHVQNDLRECDDPGEFLNSADINDDQESRLVELGLLKIID